MHVDLDAFFAAVEERENPQLRGKPVIVGADPKGGIGRGVVSTANYKAREYGIRSAMPISKAWRLCPDAVYLKPNFTLYENASAKIMKILRKYADKFEQTGIDEAFLDVSNRVKDFDEARLLAEIMKKEVLNKEKLTCSVGVGPNKLVAKLASDYRKPYGLTIVKADGIQNFLFPLRVRKLIGIGPKTEAKLLRMGVKTIGDLARFDKNVLVKTFGKWGAEMHQLANGIDDSEVIEKYEAKSIGREMTFEEDTNDQKLILNTIDKLVEDLYPEIITGNIHFKTINVKIRFENFETHTHAKTLSSSTNRKDIIKDVAKSLVLPFLQQGKKIRLIGVRVSGLGSAHRQKTLLEIN